MSSYATTADMLARFDEQELIELTDAEETGAINMARMQRAIEMADNVIDAYVAAYYKRADAVLPVPGILTDIACDIAHYRLFRRDSATESVAEQHKAALKMLSDISTGKMKIDQGVETVPPRDGQILIDGPDRRFTREKMAGY